MVPEDARPVVFEREYTSVSTRKAKRWVTREKNAKPNSGSSADFLTRSAASLELLESLGVERDVHARERVVQARARQVPRASRAPLALPPLSSASRAGANRPRRSCFGRLRSRQSRNRKSSPSPPDAATPLRVASWDQDTQCVFVRVAIPEARPRRASASSPRRAVCTCGSSPRRPKPSGTASPTMEKACA